MRRATAARPGPAAGPHLPGVRAVLLAGGQGVRMGRLTEHTCKPMVPYAGRCRLVDFSLANAVRSGVTEMVVLSHYLERDLIDHLLRHWDGRAGDGGGPATPGGEPGGLRIHFGPQDQLLPGRPGQRSGLPAGLRLPARPPDHGIADALLANARWLFAPGASDILILHADHVYSFDYRPMLAAHRASGAAATLGVQRIERRFVPLFGMVQADQAGRVRRLVEKPARPTSDLIFTAFCLFRADVLEDALTRLSQLPAGEWQHDLSRDVLPWLIARGQHVRAYPVPGYWADIGTVERYLLGHLDLIRPPGRAGPAAQLTGIPHTLPGAQSMRVGPGRVLSSGPVPAGARVRDAVLFPGCAVHPGSLIERSVLLPGATVTAAAEIRDTVVLPGETITGPRSGIDALLGTDLRGTDLRGTGPRTDQKGTSGACAES
jgi:glucose-1-phosphate adenylyltransferase